MFAISVQKIQKRVFNKDGKYLNFEKKLLYGHKPEAAIL